jgi:hypothetical protein
MTLNGVCQKEKIRHLMGYYMIPYHVLQVIEARNVGQSDLLLPGRLPTIADASRLYNFQERNWW